MSAPPERRLARGTRRRPTEEQIAHGSAPPAPPTETQVAGRAGPTAPPAGAAAERAPASPSPSGAPTAGSDSALRSALSVLTTLGPPLTIATALMFYFGWARSDEQASFMGLDVSLFGFSTQDYVLQSINTLYLPLLATAALALGWLALHQRVDRALTQPAARPALRSAGRIAMGAGLLAAATAVLVAALDRHRAPLVVPLVLAAGTAVTAYGGWLAGAAGDPRPPGPAGQPWQRALRALLVGTVITLALFWEMSVYAGVVGRGYALELARTLPSRPRATAFSATPLGIEAPGVREERLRVGPGAGNDDVRYRTTGLRFLVRSGGRLFLVHDGWTPRRGTVIVLPDNDQVRWQFSR
jgi:hypothetical protein